MAVRGVPSSNVINHTPVWAANYSRSLWDSSSFVEFASKVAAFIEKNKHVEAVVLCGWWPVHIAVAGGYYSADSVLRFPFLIKERFEDPSFSFLDIATKGADVVFAPVSNVVSRKTYRTVSGYAAASEYIAADLAASEVEGTVASSSAELYSRAAKGRNVRPVILNGGMNLYPGMAMIHPNMGVAPPIYGYSNKYDAVIGAAAYIAYALQGDVKRQNPYFDASTSGRRIKQDPRVLPVWFYRLSSPMPESSDPVNGGKSVFDVVKDRIDSIVAAEQAGSTKLPGNILIGGTGYDVGQGSVYSDGLEYGAGHVWSANTSGKTYMVEGRQITIPTNLPPGCSNTFPQSDSTWTTPVDVFFGVTGARAYFGSYGGSFKYPWKYDTFSFAPGALINATQSCGAQIDERCGVDWYYSSINLRSSDNPSPKNAFNTKTGAFLWVAPTSPNGKYYFGLRFEFVPPTGSTVTSAEVSVTADNEFTLTEDGINVAVLSVPTTSFDAAFAYLGANIPQGWDVSVSCQGVRSRSVDAILRGACFAWGAALEPYANRNPSSGFLLWALAHGMSFHEWRKIYAPNDFAAQADHDFLVVYGDPLYIPLRKNRGKAV